MDRNPGTTGRVVELSSCLLHSDAPHGGENARCGVHDGRFLQVGRRLLSLTAGREREVGVRDRAGRPAAEHACEDLAHADEGVLLTAVQVDRGDHDVSVEHGYRESALHPCCSAGTGEVLPSLLTQQTGWCGDAMTEVDRVDAWTGRGVLNGVEGGDLLVAGDESE